VGGGKKHGPAIRNSTTPAAPGQLTNSTIKKVDKLNNAKSTRIRDVNINKATTKILLKSKAVGNKAIPVENRVYLQLTFPTSKIRCVHFFSKHGSVAEALQLISNTMETAAFGSGCAEKSRLALVMYRNSQADGSQGAAGSDGGENDPLCLWSNWDSQQSLRSFFPDDKGGLHSDIEDVCVAPVALSAVLENKHKIEAAAKAGGAGRSGGAEVSQFVKNQRVSYRAAGAEPGTSEEALVRGVHTDGEGGELYYTVFFPRTQQERQTVVSRLSHMSSDAGDVEQVSPPVAQSTVAGTTTRASGCGSASSSSSGGLPRAASTSVSVAGPGETVLLFLLKNQPTEIVLPASQGVRTVADLKSFVVVHAHCGSELARALGSKTCKLLCKGKMLKGTDDFRSLVAAETKAASIKIMIIGG